MSADPFVEHFADEPDPGRDRYGDVERPTRQDAASVAGDCQPLHDRLKAEGAFKPGGEYGWIAGLFDSAAAEAHEKALDQLEERVEYLDLVDFAEAA